MLVSSVSSGNELCSHTDSPCDVTKLDQLLQDKHSALEEFDATMDTEQQAPVSNLSIEEKYLSGAIFNPNNNLLMFLFYSIIVCKGVKSHSRSICRES